MAPQTSLFHTWVMDLAFVAQLTTLHCGWKLTFRSPEWIMKASKRPVKHELNTVAVDMALDSTGEAGFRKITVGLYLHCPATLHRERKKAALVKSNQWQWLVLDVVGKFAIFHKDSSGMAPTILPGLSQVSDMSDWCLEQKKLRANANLCSAVWPLLFSSLNGNKMP